MWYVYIILPYWWCDHFLDHVYCNTSSYHFISYTICGHHCSVSESLRWSWELCMLQSARLWSCWFHGRNPNLKRYCSDVWFGAPQVMQQDLICLVKLLEYRYTNINHLFQEVYIVELLNYIYSIVDKSSHSFISTHWNMYIYT